MMRSWGVNAVPAAASPVFGDALTAAFTPGRPSDKQIVTVASTTRYMQGDRIILGAGQPKPNDLIVDALVDATHLQCRSESHAPISSWPTGTLIALSDAAAQINIQGISNAAVIVLGTDSTVTAAYGGSAFGQVPIGGSYSYGTPTGNLVRTSELWMIGTATDKVGVSALVI